MIRLIDHVSFSRGCCLEYFTSLQKNENAILSHFCSTRTTGIFFLATFLQPFPISNRPYCIATNTTQRNWHHTNSSFCCHHPQQNSNGNSSQNQCRRRVFVLEFHSIDLSDFSIASIVASPHYFAPIANYHKCHQSSLLTLIPHHWRIA